MLGQAALVARCSPSILAILSTLALCGCIGDHETEDDDSGDGDTSEGEHEGLLTSREDLPCECPAPEVPLLVLQSFASEDQELREAARDAYDEKVARAADPRQLGENIRNSRMRAREDSLASFDLGWYALAAKRLEEMFPGHGHLTHAQIYERLGARDIFGVCPTP